MTPSDLGARLLRAMRGDATGIAAIEAAEPTALHVGAADLALVVTPEAVRAVLRTLQSGAITADQAQRWASFVRRGAIDGSRVLDLEYELAYEEVIVEAVARLDELGDLVDGELRGGEFEALLRSLERRR